MSNSELHKNKVTHITIYNNKCMYYCASCKVVKDYTGHALMFSCENCCNLAETVFPDVSNSEQMKTFPALKKLILINSSIENLYVPNNLVGIILQRLNNLKTVYVNSENLQQVIFQSCKELRNFYNCSVYEFYEKNFIAESCPNFNKNAATQMEVHEVQNSSKFLKFISKTKEYKIKELSDRIEQLNKQLITITNELKEFVPALKN